MPQQVNGIDCGVYTCAFAEHLARGEQPLFSPGDIKHIRRRMAYEMLTYGLLS